MTDPKLARVRALNDRLRRTGQGGLVMMTPGIQAFGKAALAELIDAIAKFDDFTADNDPWGEHDMGSLAFRDRRVLWKIDYYDHALKAASPDPGDPAVTRRVLTIMLPEEY